MKELRETSVAILGVAIDNLTMEEVLNVVESKISEGGFHQIATANVDFLINSIHDEELRETLGRCDVVLADGMPLVWASRLLGTSLKQRVTGADLVPQLAKLSARRGYRIFLLGSSEESSAGAAAWMQVNFPGVCIAGRYCPEYQPLEEMDHEEILSRIEEARPDILLVAFGNPKQEKWLTMHRYRLKVPVCVGVGGTLDFLSGRVSRAPLWMQQTGLEWLYRMSQEPFRLAKRYVRNAAGLLRYLPVQMAAMAIQTKRGSQVEITRETVGSARVLHIDGNFTGGLLPQFESEVRSAILSGSHVVLDMSKTAYIGADAMGTLIHLLSVARRWKRELWLTGLHPFLLWVVRAAQLELSFRMAPAVAEALRRIEPEIAALPQFGDDWALCRIGGQWVPIHSHEMPELYRQVPLLLKQRVLVEPISVMSSGSHQEEGMISELVPVDAR
ncbi:MAG: WecB/TagA/CpsF family glycosyltransferase [Terracidiphilus sp.]|jgi:N-acetylglucosaminyldiphosphoundecaprenol N-acetyl-beta-D-mannosaminyltransferase